MKVLIVSSYFPPHIGGVEVVAQQQAGGLAAAGHRVTVATTRPDPGLPAEDRTDGYRVVRLPASNLLERRTGIPYPIVGPAFYRGLRRLVGWCDVVHVHDVLYQPPQVAAVLAHRCGKPLYASQHVGTVHHDSPLVLGLARASAAVAGRYIWGRARRVVAGNPLVYGYLRANGVPADRIVRIANGIDTTAFRPGRAADPAGLRARLGLPAATPVVLFVGRLTGQKGYRELIDAADPGYHIALAGPGQPPDRPPAGVSCLGALPRSELVELYRLADVFALPCAGEVFPLAMQEAMSCGLPVVTTDDPRYAEYGVDRRLLRLVRPDPGSLRAAVRAVLDDPELRRQMGSYSRRLALELFDCRTNQAALPQLYGPAPATTPAPAGAPAPVGHRRGGLQPDWS
jgi:glycosyltransferase involved in cell wall biosynthesis